MEGTLISWSGFANKASREAAWEETGVRARFLRGRFDLGSEEVGIDSGIGSDMIAGCLTKVCLYFYAACQIVS